MSMNINKIREWGQGLDLPPGLVNGHVNLWPLQGYNPKDCKVDLVVRYRYKPTCARTARQIAKSLVALFEDAGYTIQNLKVGRASISAVYGYTCSAGFEVLGFVLCDDISFPHTEGSGL